MITTDIVIAICTVITTVLSTVIAVSKVLTKKFDKIDSELKEIKTDIKSIDQRLSRLEGSFLERGQWEGRLYSMQKMMTEEKK